jgi:F0F1-type ATP synthase assembly protein I
MEPPDNPEELAKRSALVSAISLGSNLAVGMAVFAALGYYVDKRTGGGSIFTLMGIFLGLFYGGYEVWKTIRRINEEEARNAKKP